MNPITYIKKHSVVAVTAAILIVFIAIIAGRVSSRGSEAPAEPETRRVSVVAASDFREGSSRISVDGTVESVSQVDIKSQVSGQLSSVRVAVGDRVAAGQVVAEFSNADVRAQLEQARASLALAKGQYGTSGVSVDAARKAAIDAIRDANRAVDDAIRGQIDQFLLTNSGGTEPLVSHVTDQRLREAVYASRNDLTNILGAWEATIAGLSATTNTDQDIYSAIGQSKAAIAAVDSLLDYLTRALNDAIKSASPSTLATLEGWRTTVAGAKSSVSAANSRLTTADASLLSAVSSHGSPAEAQVSVAEAGVRSLEAQLAKTVIISPISGSVAALPLRAGEFAAPGQLIATVVGGGGLEVRAYVSGEDLSRIAKGASATVNGSIAAVVQSVAPSVSQSTRKAEVRLSVTDPASSNLVVGQSVRASIEATASASSSGDSYFLPIQNVKIVPGDAYVLTVGDDSKLVRNPVVLGGVEGSFVEVKAGLADDMMIVAPVYGLEEGTEVKVE